MTDRASAEELREAARAMWYAHTEDQRFAGPVSADPYRDFERALLAAIRDTGSRPDSADPPDTVRIGSQTYLAGYDGDTGPRPDSGIDDWTRVAEAWANVMDGRRIGSGLNAARIGRDTTTGDDWHAIAREYAALASERTEP